MKVLLSIIIVNYRVEKEVIALVNSILKQKMKLTYEIIVINNSREKNFSQKLNNVSPSVVFIQSKKNVGFGAANNIGASRARGEILFFVNPDCLIEGGSIETILSYLDKKGVGIVAPLLVDQSQKPFELQGTKELTPWRAIFSLSLINRFFPKNPVATDYWMINWNKAKDKQVDVAPGTALFMKRSLFIELGGFDENFFLFFEEFDLCKRVRAKGLRIIISPVLKVQHLWGNSVRQNNLSATYFNQSRFYYFKKNYGLLNALLVSSLLRITGFSIVLFCVFTLALLLRVYKLPETMVFLGDQGWFYLSALDILTQGQIPLVGIPSSVVWLHQGPLSTYFIALALFFGKMNPAAPAYVFGILDAFTVIVLYFVGKAIFKKRAVGVLASLFYATSPLVLITARTPYHTSLVPLITSFFLLIALSVYHGSKKYIPLLLFLFGLLLQLELSNVVLLVCIIAIFLIKRIKMNRREIIISLFAFACGILPFILYDIFHKFTQTLGLPLWALNRIRLFLGLTVSNNSTTGNVPSAIATSLDQLMGIFSYRYPLVAGFCLIAFLYLLYVLLKRRQNEQLIFCLIMLFIPLSGFLVHAAPGVAYFPLLFPMVSVLSAASVYYLGGIMRWVGISILIAMVIVNGYAMVSNDYFISIQNNPRFLPVNGYSYGYALPLVQEAADFIGKQKNRGGVTIIGKGFYSKFSSNFDNIKFLLKKDNIVVVNGGGVIYNIYASKKEVDPKEKIVFENDIFIITQ